MRIEPASSGERLRAVGAGAAEQTGPTSPPPGGLPSAFYGAGWLAVAVAIAIGLEAMIMARAVAINVDGLMFIDVARQLERDPLRAMRTNDQHPGYPAMIVAAERMLELFGFAPGPRLWTAATLAAPGVCGVLSVIAMWLFARRMFGRQAANLAALSMSVLPLFRMNASDALSDTPHLLFYLLAAWFAAEGFSSGRVRWWAACGLAGGAAFWVRPEGLEAPLVGGLLLLAMLALRGRFSLGGTPKTQTLRCLGALAGSAAAVILPYMLLAGKITSKQLPFFKRESVPLFIVTESQEAARLAAQEKASDCPAAEAPAVAQQPSPAAQALPTPYGPMDDVPYFPPGPEFKLARQAAKQKALADSQSAPAPHPAPSVADAASSAFSFRVALRIAGRATVAFCKNMAWGFRFAFLPLYFLGNWEMIRRRVPWWTIALPAGAGVLHIGILYWVYFLSGYMDQRHVMVLVAMALPFTALGMLYAAELINRFVGARFSQRAALALVVVAASAAVVPRATVRMNSDLGPVFATAEWIHAHAEPGEAVISNTPFVPFYGQTPGVRLTPETATVEAAIHSGPANLSYDFAVLDLKVEGYRPQWREQIERDFDEVMRLDDPRGHGPKLLVYRRRSVAGQLPLSGAEAPEFAPRIGSTPGATLQ